MPVETEVKAVEAAVENKAEEVKDAVVEEVKKAEEVVAKVEKKTRIELEATESLFLRTVEAEWLRSQVEIRDIQTSLKAAMDKAEASSKKHLEKVEELGVKYGANKVEYMFDNIENVFKAKPKPPAAK